MFRTTMKSRLHRGTVAAASLRYECNRSHLLAAEPAHTAVADLLAG